MNKEKSQTKTMMLVFGIILLILGVFFLGYGLMNFGQGFQAPESSMSGFNSHINEAFSSIIFIALGGFFLLIGIALIYISKLRKITKYIATETAPAVETTTHAVGKGLGSGLKESKVLEKSSTENIKIRCPHCKYLESIDAEYCSKCGKKI